MGFQDRGYNRSPVAGFAPEWSAVNAIIAVNAAIWLANFVIVGALFKDVVPGFSLNEEFCLRSDQPWKVWTFLTYGFLHDQRDPFHIIFNMLTLWFFGRPVEAITGRAEFVRFYLTAIVVAGGAWLVGERLGGGRGLLVGASGGVMAVLAAFIWYYPRQTVLIYGIVPVPAWALGVLYVVSDLQGARSQAGNVAHVAHLAGAAFGVLYVWRGWSLDGLARGPARLWAGLGRRRLRVVRPDDDRSGGAGGDEPPLEREVDRILEKISRSGESSLTPAERDTLTRASRRFKDRRGP